MILQCERITYPIQKFNSRDFIEISLGPHNEQQDRAKSMKIRDFRQKLKNNYNSLYITQGKDM